MQSSPWLQVTPQNAQACRGQRWWGTLDSDCADYHSWSLLAAWSSLVYLMSCSRHTAGERHSLWLSRCALVLEGALGALQVRRLKPELSRTRS